MCGRFILNVYATGLLVCKEFRRDNREGKRLLSACLFLFVSNKLSSIEGFSFIASWLGVLGNAVCYCLRPCPH